jgi:hypothetical protein
MMTHVVPQGTVSPTLAEYGRIVKGADDLARCEAIDKFAIRWGSMRQHGSLASKHKVGWAHGWNKVMPRKFHLDTHTLTQMRNMLPCLQHMVEMGHQALVPIKVQRLAVYGLFKSIKDDSLRARIMVDATIALGTPIGGQSIKTEMEAVSEVVKTLVPAHYAKWKQAHAKVSLTREQQEMKLVIMNKLEPLVDALVTRIDLQTLAGLEGPELFRLL